MPKIITKNISQNISPQNCRLYVPPAPAGDASEGVCRGPSGGESSPTVAVTGSPPRPAPGTELAGVETADGQGHREGQREAADSGTASPGGAELSVATERELCYCRKFSL